jgi:hypothetical protein
VANLQRPAGNLVCRDCGLSVSPIFYARCQKGGRVRCIFGDSSNGSGDFARDKCILVRIFSIICARGALADYRCVYDVRNVATGSLGRASRPRATPLIDHLTVRRIRLDIGYTTMNLRRIHKIVGVVLAIPLLGWALTGVVFLTKPGYEGAYEQLAIRTYPLEQAFSLTPAANWHEARLLRTVLGYHLLLGVNGSRTHLDPQSLETRGLPSDADIQRLVADAIGTNAQRYGTIVAVNGGRVMTSTGVQITLDWMNLSLAQAGRDTRLLNGLYKIHYLQWLGRPIPDALLGVAGIVLLLLLTGLGLAVFSLSRRK